MKPNVCFKSPVLTKKALKEISQFDKTPLVHNYGLGVDVFSLRKKDI